jgi:tetratricopeptide (TPR) repeat protein
VTEQAGTRHRLAVRGAVQYVAPHLAVALIYTSIAASELRGVDAAEGAELQGGVIESVRQPLIEQAKALFAGYPAEALEYVNAIARLDELSDHVPRNDAKIHRFGEALAHLSSSIKTVLGPGESECNGALAKFIAEEGARHQAVHEAGQKCQRLRNRESAALFFRRAGDYAQALQCITEQLARLGVKQVEERDRVQQAGDTVREIASKDLGEHPERRQHIENYDNLKVATSLIASNRRGRYSEAVEALRGLTFLPQLSARAPELAQSAKQLPWMLSERLADVILAAGESLQQFARSDRSGDAKEHFQALLTFVSHCNIGLPTGLYNKLVAMEPI